MGNNMSSNFSNEKLKDSFNEYFSTEEGQEEAAKTLPILLGGSAQSIENSFKDVQQKVTVALSGIKSTSEQIERHSELLKQIIDHIGLNLNQQSEPQASGQIQPTQPTQPQQSDLGDLGNILNQIRQNSQQSQQQ